MKKLLLPFLFLLLWLNSASAVFIEWPDLNPHPGGTLGYKVYVGVESGTGNFVHVKDVGRALRAEMPTPPAGATYYYFVAAYFLDGPDAGLESRYDPAYELGYRVASLTGAPPSFVIKIPPGPHYILTLWRIDTDKFWMPVGTVFGPRDLTILIDVRERQRFWEAVDLNDPPSPDVRRPGTVPACEDTKEMKRRLKEQEKLSKRWKSNEPHLAPGQ